ncbi:hypothetical protein EMPS_11285 [Entomortierella parvispora]|uniref:SH3 domain-containing protein n=1 Tax=Entomortierella parvispora TaxID=205924 RepID=A0A9P3M1U0_9FUNG|nr:hypothetical protein EMPS_11285 [Entomortierella parvispora]
MAQVLHAKALFECQGDEESELSFLEGDILVNVKETSEEGWLHGRLKRTGEEGLFPDNYVELVYIEAPTPPAASAPPTLPARSPSTQSKSTPPISKQTSNVDIPNPLTPKPAQATTPVLPTRPNQASTPASTSPSSTFGGVKAGLRSVEKTNGARGLGGSAAMALPGLGPRSTFSGTSRDDTSAQLPREPPSLPRRSNTVHETNTDSSEKASNGPALSVRERMANLSMANQRLTTPASPSGSSVLQSPLQLPARPSVGTPIAPKPNPAARSPLSSASRPALPPRTLTESPVDKGMLRSGYSAASKQASPSAFQVQDAAVPVPKLTTFSRPRSARTSKSGGNNSGSNPSLKEGEEPMKSASTIPVATAGSNRNEAQDSSAPPKLPSRAGPSSNGSSTSPDSGPVRFSPVAIRSSNAAAANNALPTISRNSQPLQLPTRPGAGSPNVAATAASPSSGLARSATTATSTGRPNTLQNNNNKDSNSSKGPISPFGVKLTSVNGGRPMTSYSAPAAAVAASSTLNDALDKAPPLPARANTIASSATAASPSTSGEQRYLSSTSRSLKDDPPSMGHHLSSLIQERERERISNPPVSSPSWANGRSSPLKGSTVGTRVAMMPPAQIPDMTPSEDVGIKKNVLMRYEALFRDSTTGEYMDGAQVHAIYVKSRLDSKTLAQIWDMVDVDNAGRLSRAQFCMGLYLIDERLASGLIPLEVSDELWVSVMI